MSFIVSIDSFLNKNRLYGRYDSIGVHPVGIEHATSPIMSWASVKMKEHRFKLWILELREIIRESKNSPLDKPHFFLIKRV
ncbi:hypothetical protein MTR_4g069820 [Medicago truncatula]|uniref:Uncharacterized protein n=1 Tax=Medicago truncatula TaxID=3880 RepID=G7JG41_MEDTR|nr:hypothetical protein MTR_4g069820 [Medicago truncatula]